MAPAIQPDPTAPALERPAGQRLPPRRRAPAERSRGGAPMFWLGLGIVAICLANVANLLAGQPFWPLTRLINLGLESNLPTWYTSMLWAAAAVVAWGRRDPGGGRAKLTWTALAALFAALSLDEVAMIHENVGCLVATRVLGEYGTLFKTARWTLSLGPLALIGFLALGIYAKPVLAREPRGLRLIFLGIGLFLFAALGVEATTNLLNHETLQWLWNVEIVVEETLEMAGIWVVIEGCLAYS